VALLIDGRLVLGLFSVFALFHWSATVLGSDRGQMGIIVGAIVVAATLAAERLLFGQPPSVAARTVGLGRPDLTGLTAAGIVGVSILLVVPVFVLVTGAAVTWIPGSLPLLPGLFAQAGIAEEVLFRGFLFGRLRRGRSFLRAATLATVPFAAVHLLMFLTMPWPVAAAALLLSLVLSFPLAALFELGGSTIWAPAVVHFAVQGTVKVLDVSGEGAAVFPLVWMAASALLPLPVLLHPSLDLRHSANEKGLPARQM
jgi:membrane protease YdiL (CAAX protease family)